MATHFEFARSFCQLFRRAIEFVGQHRYKKIHTPVESFNNDTMATHKTIDLTRDERYFDWAATAMPLPGLPARIVETVEERWANPSSAHAFGLEAKRLLEDARARVAAALDIDPSSVVFTSGTTEGNNLVVLPFGSRPGAGAFVVDAYAHEALIGPLARLESQGYRGRVLKPWNRHTAERTAEVIESKTRLVAITHVASETGEIAPLGPLIDAVRSAQHKRHVHIHVDAAQSSYRLREAVHAGADTIAFGTHKFGAPGGSGILVCNRTVNLPWRGGPQEGGRRPGTPNLYGALIAAAAVEHVTRQEIVHHVEHLGRMLFDRLAECEGVWFVPPQRGVEPTRYANMLATAGGSRVGRLATAGGDTGRTGGAAAEYGVAYSPHIVAVAFPPVPGTVLIRALSTRGFMASAGTACGGGDKAVPRLLARGVPGDVAESMIRLSIGPRSSKRAVEALCGALQSCVKTLGSAYGRQRSGGL